MHFKFLFLFELIRKPRVWCLFFGSVFGYYLVEFLQYSYSDQNKESNSQLEVPLNESEVLLRFQKFQQNYSEIIDYIRKRHIFPPPPSPNGAITYRLSERYKRVRENPDKNVTKFLINLGIFKYQEDGFFIESGANNGFILSNTVDLEIEYGWTGLLIEADPSHHKSLKRSNRNAWIADVCISPKPYTTELEMRRHKTSKARSLIPGYINGVTEEEYPVKFKVPCFPLFSILVSINIFKVDFVSLDIEGAELDVLKTIPFDSVVIKAFQIEACHERYEPVKRFIESNGYKEVLSIKNPSSCDQIYVLESLLNVNGNEHS